MRKIIYLFLLPMTIWSQTPETITKTNYTVTGNETIIASQSIVIKPNSLIQLGSTFTAKIDSDAFGAIMLSNENYIFSRNYQKAIKNSTEVTSNKDIIDNINYYDGLGRTMQNVAIKASPTYKDIITHIGYDALGRQEKEYIPYMETIGSVGTYRKNADVNTNNYYITSYPLDINSAIPNPFSKKKFDDSPLNRVIQQAGPGEDWALGGSHDVKIDYQTNVANEVKLYTVMLSLVNKTYIPTLTLSAANGGYYAAGQLYKTISKNENWTIGNNNTTEEFKDKKGRVILKKNYGVSRVNNVEINTSHETYYIYDIYGNLTYVLPPKMDGNINYLNDLCYQYKYDIKNRLVEKKLPGKEWEYIVYDKLDRAILTQDINLRANNKWIYTKYDTFNRAVYSGEYTDLINITRTLVQTAADSSSSLSETRTSNSISIGSTSNIYYTNNSFPTGILQSATIDVYTINYFDTYLNIDLDGGTISNATSYNVAPISNAKGLTTCVKVRVLGTNDWITNVIYYDKKGRVIYNYNKNNFLKLTNTFKNQIDFNGKILETTSTHKKDESSPIIIVDTFSYDHMGRKLTQTQKVNSQLPEVISSSIYNNLGELITKGVGGKVNQSRLQILNLDYNIRGWLKSLNDSDIANNSFTLTTGDLFGFQINYNSTSSTGNPIYNGNISQTFWKTSNTDNSLKSYNYTYDGLNRLTRATDNSSNNPGRYNEDLIYDKNGNVMKLVRLGNTDENATSFGVMDDLLYTYDFGNKLVKVEDAGSTEGFNNGSSGIVEYTYDNNGNVKTDANKGIIAISYNYLNLPDEISLTSGAINYTYDATGNKQRKIVNGITTEYAAGFVYENNVLKFFPHSEGYVANNTGIFDYIYHYKDHLGNVRLSYGDKDNNGVVDNTEILEENNYYAFGLIQKGYNSTKNYGKGNVAGQKYKYNNKEFQNELKLNMYDYGARNYDSSLGRWMNIDPLSEKFETWSPYNYCMNNPVYFVDPNGMDVSNYYDRNNAQIYSFTGRGVENESSSDRGGLANPVYGSDGKYRGNTLEGFTGVPIIYDGPADFSKLNAGALLTLGGRYFNFQLTPSAQANMVNNIVEGTEYFVNLFYDNISDKTFSFGSFLKPLTFQISELRGGSTSVNLWAKGGFNNPSSSVGANFTNQLFPDGSYSITSYGSLSFEPTVENIRASIIIHEGLVHGKWGFGDVNSKHRIAYLAVINSNLFNNTTANFKAHNMNQYANYSSAEAPKELDEVIIGGQK